MGVCTWIVAIKMNKFNLRISELSFLDTVFNSRV